MIGSSNHAPGAGADELAGDPSAEVSHNLATRKKQRIILYSLGGLMVAAGMAWILSPTGSQKTPLEDASGAKSVKISTGDMVDRNMANQEWMAMSENEIAAQGTQIKGLQGDTTKIDNLQKQITALQGQNTSLKADGSKVLSAYQTENETLRSQLSTLSTQVQRATSGPSSMYGPGAPGTYQRAPGAPGAGPGAGPGASAGGVAGMVGGAAGSEGPERSNAVKLISFTGEGTGTGSKIAPGKSTQYTDSINYLPPNSIATARVIVGVDANTNTRGQADPLPVVLRITGSARSVYADGKLLRTNIVGCMVNGAAQADLSSEKVYVKLQRMTCPQPGGRVAVSEVKGFIAFGGKTGVRGRVVSRTGNLVGQAMIAGVLGGFGRGFSANSQSALTAPSVNINGQRASLSPGQLASGGLGEGVASSADMVSKYLIERAEQYQPVVEMPTGLDVEVVFLDGVFVRN